MRSKLTLIACIVVLLGGYVWGADYHMSTVSKINTEISRLQEDRYFLENGYLDLERRNDNMVEYMKTRFNMMDAEINYAQEWRK